MKPSEKHQVVQDQIQAHSTGNPALAREGPEKLDGGLYIVPTPIGNLQDITLRALDILKKVDLILAEDTRVSIRLLNHYQIVKALSPYHQHNEHKVLHHLVDQLMQGKTMALLTDAGTPG